MNADIHHLAGAYALDALDRSEREAFEAHFPSCDVCRDDVAGYRETAQVLASAVATSPPASLKRDVMAAIGTTRQLPPRLPDRVIDLAERRRRLGRRAGALAAAAAVVVAVVGLAAALLSTDSPGEIEAVLAAPDAAVTILEGDRGDLRLVWSAERDQVALFGENLAATEPGFAYALWFLLDDGVAPAGLFGPDDDGNLRAVLDVADLDGNGFGVTIEPASGSDEPTTPVIYAGTV